ncbi:hypothetical protein D0Y65_038247 [Glycine soja]|uniref:Solute carrier family 25 member 44 n=1 Tax=Glycine soja TaxID=3848 RepID=A0A0B2P9C7_GLYSO|nr:Solute carrier family 25 member 44 [Glycine soja]RZB68393.1 hypothetical protein D0Y65_038247 [Glycine soja]
MLDKSKFFFLGASLFSALSAALYPAVVLKTRQQVSSAKVSCGNMSRAIMRCEGFRVTKSNVGTATVHLGFSDTSAATIANAAGGLASACPHNCCGPQLMSNGFEALRKILGVDGPRGFYRGFGVSIVTYVPSNAVWWASYSMVVVVTLILDAIPRYHMSVSVSYSIFVLVWMLHKLQVLDSEEIKGQRRSLTLVQVVRNSVKKGGILGCYKGLGPRWASMSMSAATMITTYEFLKRVSAKNLDRLTV